MTQSINVGTKTANILDLDATALVEMIKNKEISSVETVEIYIQQIKEINPSVNCLVEDRFEQALEEAAYTDRRIKENKAEGKLIGVPISMKESFHVQGMKTTGGLVIRKTAVQSSDADVVHRLKAEGAIILGKTNTPELCFCQETDNKLYGRTNNPRDLTKTVGGSSGGEAAMISIGGAAVGLGSDIGGSIRFPSHFNGVIGFKSGKGQVSSAGSYPAEVEVLQQRMLGIGPIAKSVRDAKLLYDIVANKNAEEKQLNNITVNILPETDYPLSFETKLLMDQVYEVINSTLPTENNIPPFFDESARIWQEIMSINGASGVGKEAYGDKKVQPIRSYFKEIIGGNSDNHRYLSWALIGTSLFKPTKKRVEEIRAYIVHGDIELDRYLENRVVVLPVYHSAATKHGGVYKELFSIRKTYMKYMPYVAYANVWGLPSLTIPVGLDESGMPIAVQLVSKNGNEAVLFKVGQLLEEKFLGYVRVK
ncbi:amidase [Sporosarcina sp. CAU 1771]